MSGRRERGAAAPAGGRDLAGGKPLTVLLVCSGNTCRSPMAEGILGRLLGESLGKRVKVHSAGVAAQEGMPASAEARKLARARNIPLDAFLSRRLTRRMIAEADLILTMNGAQREAVLRLDPRSERRVHLLKAYAADLPPGAGEPIEDPVGGDARLYRRVFNEIKVALEAALGRITALAEDRDPPPGANQCRKHGKGRS